MPIEFHCEHCGKLIRSGEEHAGKHGKCPACHQSVYIPTPSDQLEPLHLAPLDEKEERERQKMLQASRELAQRLLREREAGPDTGHGRAAAPASAPGGDARLNPDMETLVIEYAICMADGNLAEAEELAVDIRRNMKQAEDVMQRLTLDEMPPPQLTKIPRPVLVGFFRQLREPKK
jgi:hypothetical protein